MQASELALGLGDRLKEERLRLRLNQTALGALSGSSKASVINWEKGVNSPPASALTAFAAAGMDVLYVLIGRRTDEHPDSISRLIRDDLNSIRRSMLLSPPDPAPGETARTADEKMRREHSESLQLIIDRSTSWMMKPGQAEEAAALLAILSDRKRLAAFRAADMAQNRDQRAVTREDLSGWFIPDPEQERFGPPGDRAMDLLVTLVLEYGVPERMAWELVEELREDLHVQIGTIL